MLSAMTVFDYSIFCWNQRRGHGDYRSVTLIPTDDALPIELVTFPVLPAVTMVMNRTHMASIKRRMCCGDGLYQVDP